MANRSVKVMFLLLAALAVLFAVFGGPQPLAFWPLEGPADFLQRVTPLFLVALFVERALEVFVTAWRAPAEKQMRTAQRHAAIEAKPQMDAEFAQYKSETQRIAFSAGIALGIVVSAVGIRALALFIYSDQIEALTGWQKPLFTVVDVLVTGALIGGGADGVHKIVKVFLSFMDTTSAKIEAQRPASAPEP